MKTKTLKLMISLLMVTIQLNVSASQDLKPVNTAYTYYVWMREFLYTNCFLFWVIDHEKINESVIYCNACNYFVGSFYTYGFFMGAADDQVLAKLKKLLRKGNKQQIINFLLKLYNEREMNCSRCHKYCGWHQADKGCAGSAGVD
jgi:hypothetical protein